MNFLKSILWVPMVFGIIMGGLAIAHLIASGVGTEFVAFPAQIMSAYNALTDAIAFYLFELPFQIELSEPLKHLLVVWLVFAGSNFRFLVFRRRQQGLLQPMGLVGDFTGSVLFGPLMTVSIFLDFLKIGATERSIISRYLIDRMRSDDPYHDGEVPTSIEERAAYKQNLEARLERLVTIAKTERRLLILILMANPIIAAGLLWWNAAEIERLTSLIG